MCTVHFWLLKTSPKRLCALAAALVFGIISFADGKELDINTTVQQSFTCITCKDCIGQITAMWCKDEKIWSLKKGMRHCSDSIVQTGVPCHQDGRVYLLINKDVHSRCGSIDMEGKNGYINSYETECPQSQTLPPTNPQGGIPNTPSSDSQGGIPKTPSSDPQGGIPKTPSSDSRIDINILFSVTGGVLFLVGCAICWIKRSPQTFLRHPSCLRGIPVCSTAEGTPLKPSPDPAQNPTPASVLPCSPA